MPALTPQRLVLALLLIAPGFIAVFVAITIGVIEREVSNGRILIVSFVSSIVVDTLFLIVASLCGESVGTPYAFQQIIFTSGFSPEYIGLLLLLSVSLGFVYSLTIILDLHGQVRKLMWSFSDRDRFPWQPWDGMMQDSFAVQVTTSDDEVVKGFLHEYSRAERPRQLRLKNPQWFGRTDWNPPKETDVLLLQDDIDRISVLMTIEEFEASQEVENAAKDGEPAVEESDGE